MADEEATEEEGAKKGGMMGKILMILPTLLLIGAAVWYFFLRAEPETTKEVKLTIPAPTPGPVVVMDPMTINLAGGHYLKLGLTLQTDATATEVSGAKAADLAIGQFSGADITTLSTSAGRVMAKRALIARVKFAYLPATEEADDAKLVALKSGLKLDPVGVAPGDVSGFKDINGDNMDEETDSKQGDTVAELDPSLLTDNQIIAAAEVLAAVPGVYDVYFTEWVMQ